MAMRRGTKSKTQSTIRTPKMILNFIKNSIYLLTKQFTIISSLIHLRDYPLYAWAQVYTIRVHTTTSCRDFRQSSLQFGRAPFNPHLPHSVPFLSFRRYQLPGAEISEYWSITVRGIFPGVVARRGDLIHLYRGDGLWYRFRLGVLVTEE